VARTQVIEALRKVLVLEAAKGFADSAVIGGLDAYASTLLDEHASSLSPGVTRQLRFLRNDKVGYRGWQRPERETWVQKTMQAIDPQPGPDGRDAEQVQRQVGADRVASSSSSHTSSDAPPESPDIHSSITPGRSRKSVTALRGISTKTAANLARLGVSTIVDLVYLLPRRYLDYTQIRRVSELEIDMDQTVIGTVVRVRVRRFGDRPGTEAYLRDGSGMVRVLWFNQPWVARNLPANREIVVSGTVRLFRSEKVIESPEWEPAHSAGIHTGRLVPVYPLTSGLSSRQMRRWMVEALERCATDVAEYLPAEIAARQQLMSLPDAVHEAHFPSNLERAAMARQRLAFDDLLSLQLGLRMTKRYWQHSQPGIPLRIDRSFLRAYMQNLPFTLTAAQQKVLNEIEHDVARPVAMSRLLQGEVGSGKTVVALAAVLMAVSNGLQGALMAPTEVLAEQHYRTIELLLRGSEGHDNGDTTPSAGSPALELLRNPIRTIPGVGGHQTTLALLTGSLTAANRRRVHAQLASGRVDIVVGTQALIQREVTFKRLGLAVVDEQHRFGVLQRGGLRQKGFNPHVLVMTATPIPRSLALAVYGDLDLSVIDSLPPGRQKTVTRVISSSQMDRLYRFLRSQIREGRQAYVICPLISESPKLEARAATEEYRRLSEVVFPDLRLGLLHGGLAPKQKDEVMRTFRDASTDILVSTTVVEVGIDVPNATVMIVLGAERFGLSQLHQLRGRVGRGTERSYCILVSDAPSTATRERLRVVEATQDGFALASHDLRLRGPGDFLGTQQTGLPELRVATLTDLSMLEAARSEALRLIDDSRFDSAAEYAAVRQRVVELWRDNVEWS
jgi:ATP-dependent DNA helicase RecG